MASRRFLILWRSHFIFVGYFGILFLASVLITSCGTSKKTSKQDGPSAADDKTAKEATVDEAFLTVLNTNRSMLSDAYSNLNNDIPEVFLKNSMAPDIGDPYQGYRIQILSTRNVNKADSLANDFHFWADTAMVGYTPRAYVLFLQPYYKVHIGNFHFQEQAIELNQKLKSRYPDAWVVPDGIEPELVPSDTVRFAPSDSTSLKRR